MNNLLSSYPREKLNAMRDIQKVKECERINKLEATQTSILANLIIKPVNSRDNTFNNNDYEETKVKYNTDKEKYWANRNNVLYKGITDASTNIKTESEFIIHKVTDIDKIGTEERYNKFRNDIETHNNELKEKYALDKEASNRKKFEYSHRYSNRKKYNPSSHTEMKNSVEKCMMEKEVLVSQLVSNGIFSIDELKMFGVE